MKRSKSILAILLVLALVLAPIFSPVHTHAAEALSITGVSGDASSIKLTTSLSYSTVTSAFMDGNVDTNLHTYPSMSLTGLENNSGMAVIILKPEREPSTFTAGRYFTIYGDSTVTLSGQTMTLGQDMSFWFDGSSWSSIDKTGDILSGYDFEENSDALHFDGVGGNNLWRDASFGIVEIDGDNALKLTCPASQWPTFRINFGKTLKAGTTITFDAYTNDTSGIRNTVSIFEYVAGGEATAQYYHGSWNTLTITLAEDCDHVDLSCNMDRWSEPGSANIEVYMDNFKAVEPADPGEVFINGIDFNNADHLELFTGVGGSNEWRDATFAIVSFDGDNALKLTCASSQWPTFRINFGKTLKAGTTITFEAYTNDKAGIRNTVSIFEYVAGGEATAQYYHGSWNTLTITLASDCDHIDLMCNMDRWSEPGPANLEVYMDNFKAVEPGAPTEPEVTEPAPTEPAEPVGDFIAGIDFETAGNELWFTGSGNASSDATVERVTYTALGVDAPTNGGSYALKVSHNSNEYPTFRINFGKTLKKGTSIVFDAYASTDGNAIALMDSTWTQAAYLPANAWRTNLTWEITLSSDCDHIDMLWERRGASQVPSYIIIDNIKAKEPIPTISEGFTFENNTDAGYFTGVGGGNAWRDATFEVVSFDGDNALKLTCAASQWPTFRINFGETLAAGQQIKFQAYTNDTSGIRTTVSIFEYVSGGEATVQYYHGSWNDLAITLTSDCDHIDLMLNMDRWSEVSSANLEVYMDNFEVHTLGAAKTENQVAADCVNAGSYDTVVYCTDCGAELSRVTTTVDALGHTEVVDAAVAPGCESTGLTEGKHCSVCGAVTVSQNEIPANGHSYSSAVTAPTATKEGFTTYTCGSCGHSYVDNIVPAVGIGELKFSGAALLLKDNLNVNFSVASELFIEDAYSAPYVVFNVGVKTQTVTEYTVVDGKYVFTCTNLAPSQMGDTITATLYATLNGELHSLAMEYSVADYCYNMLGKTEDAKLQTLLVDLLNYGAAAQTYAWYKDKTLCNTDLTAEQQAWGTQTAPELSSKLNTKAAVVDNAKATWKAASLVLENSVTMRFRFAAESVDGLTVKIVNGDQEWIISEFTAAEQAGQYYVYFNGLSARQMRDVVSVTVYEGDTAVSNTLEYSVETYAYNKQSEARVSDLVIAMMKYGDSAAAYLN